MSRFFSNKYKSLIPYVPGEQPKDMKYIKLNTNESPFSPSKKAIEKASEAAKVLQLYSDPDSTILVEKLAEVYGVNKDQVTVNNGSDETLNFAFMAYCDENHPAAFPNISYGFYPVFARLNNIPYEEIPLNADFTINVDDYIGINKTIFIANPNAPTGIALPLSDIERIVSSNKDNIVVIDEAYVDFGADSAVSLVDKYDNLLVVQTFSKSRSLAGGRLGFAIANKNIIQDLNTIKYSTNPYNINRMTMAAGVGALEDEEYTRANCQKIIENRAYTVSELKKLGFVLTDSKTNFLWAKTNKMSGKDLYLTLKKNGILVRYFDKELLKDYVRITIGSKEQMETFIKTLKNILEA